MTTLQEWANWYQHMQVWVYPYNQDTALDDWKYWRNIKSNDAYTNLSATWNWDDTGIKLAVGKKGIRVLLLKDYFQYDKDKIVSKALEYLKLPDSYPWIIENDACVVIIVDTPNTAPSTKGLSNKKYKELTLLWQGSIILPPSNGNVKFYKGRSPKAHPTQIEDDILLNSINSIILYMRQVHRDSTKNERKKTLRYYFIRVPIVLLLLALTGLFPFVGLPVLVAFFWVNWDKLFSKKEKGKEE